MFLNFGLNLTRVSLEVELHLSFGNGNFCRVIDLSLGIRLQLCVEEAHLCGAEEPVSLGKGQRKAVDAKLVGKKRLDRICLNAWQVEICHGNI